MSPQLRLKCVQVRDYIYIYVCVYVYVYIAGTGSCVHEPIHHIFRSFVGQQEDGLLPPCKLEVLHLFRWYTHTHAHTHTNSPTITPSSLSYFLSPSCLSMLSLSLEKLVTCGVIRSYNYREMHLHTRGSTQGGAFTKR